MLSSIGLQLLPKSQHVKLFCRPLQHVLFTGPSRQLKSVLRARHQSNNRAQPFLTQKLDFKLSDESILSSDEASVKDVLCILKVLKDPVRTDSFVARYIANNPRWLTTGSVLTLAIQTLSACGTPLASLDLIAKAAEHSENLTVNDDGSESFTECSVHEISLTAAFASLRSVRIYIRMNICILIIHIPCACIFVTMKS